VPGVPAAFGDRDTLLALQKRWESRLRGQVEMLLEMGEDDVTGEVVHPLRDAVTAQPGLRRFLDRHAGRPAPQHVLREQKRFLAVNAGLATFDTPPRSPSPRGRRCSPSSGCRGHATLRERLLSALCGGGAVVTPDSAS
jgi:hypothetical protein